MFFVRWVGVNMSFNKFQNSTFFVIEEWDLKNGGLNVERYATNFFYGQKILPEQINWKKRLSNVNFLINEIPFIQFSANSFQAPDLWNVPLKLFRDFEKHLEILLSDSLVNKGLMVLNIPGTQSSQRDVETLENAVKDPSKVVHRNSGQYSIFNTLDPLQGQTNGQEIITKLNYYERQIKKFGFVRTDTQNIGTKNIGGSEMAALNSDADDYLEMKANLLEICWQQFIERCYIPYLISTDEKFLNQENLIGNVAVDVECCGSTKYLKNKANVPVQSQQGVLTNPNDLINEKKEIEVNKNEKIQQN